MFLIEHQNMGIPKFGEKIVFTKENFKKFVIDPLNYF